MRPLTPNLTRSLLLVYAAYAAVAGFLLWRDPGPLAGAGAVCSWLAGAVSLAGAARGTGEGRSSAGTGRRWVVGLHAVLVPGQFVLSIPSDVPLLGMLLSIAIVLSARPVLPRLRPGARKLFLTLHVGFSVGWLGLSAAMTALAVIGLATGDESLRHDVYRVMHLFDLTIVIPVVVLAILSGLVVSLFTPWGLTRHWWVLIKLVLAVGIPAVAGVQHFWISDLITRTAEDPQAVPGSRGIRLLVCFLAYDAVLWTATALSVYKPGGRTPWGRRKVTIVSV